MNEEEEEGAKIYLKKWQMNRVRQDELVRLSANWLDQGARNLVGSPIDLSYIFQRGGGYSILHLHTSHTPTHNTHHTTHSYSQHTSHTDSQHITHTYSQHIIHLRTTHITHTYS